MRCSEWKIRVSRSSALGELFTRVVLLVVEILFASVCFCFFVFIIDILRLSKNRRLFIFFYFSVIAAYYSFYRHLFHEFLLIIKWVKLIQHQWFDLQAFSILMIIYPSAGRNSEILAWDTLHYSITNNRGNNRFNNFKFVTELSPCHYHKSQIRFGQLNIES